MKKHLFLILIVSALASLLGCNPTTTEPGKVRMRKITFIYNGGGNTGGKDKYDDSTYYANGAYPIVDSLGTGIGLSDSLSNDHKLLILRAVDQYEPIVNPDEERPHQNPARVVDIYLTSSEPIVAGQHFTFDNPSSKVVAAIGLDVPFPTYSTGGSQYYTTKSLTFDITDIEITGEANIVELHGTFSGTFENEYGTLLKVDSGAVDIVK